MQKKQWTETVLAKDYIEFLDLLWSRVRPDILFPPPPLKEGEERPPLFSTTMIKDKEKAVGKRGKKGRKRRRKDRRIGDAGLNQRRHQKPTANNADGSRGGGVRGMMPGRFCNNRPPPPPPLPPPTTIEGLVLLHIPRFRPEEAQRAPWVLKGGLIDPAVGQALGLGINVAGTDRGRVDHRGKKSGERGDGAREGQKKRQETGVEQPRWKERRRKRLVASGVVEEKEVIGGRKGDWGRDKGEHMEEMESIRNFVARNFSDAPREVR